MATKCFNYDFNESPVMYSLLNTLMIFSKMLLLYQDFFIVAIKQNGFGVLTLKYYCLSDYLSRCYSWLLEHVLFIVIVRKNYCLSFGPWGRYKKIYSEACA